MIFPVLGLGYELDYLHVVYPGLQLNIKHLKLQTVNLYNFLCVNLLFLLLYHNSTF